MKLRQSDIIMLEEECTSYIEKYMNCFGRIEVQNQATHYLQGLLHPIEGKNCWKLSQYTQQKNPQALQRFLRESIWDEKKITGNYASRSETNVW